ncbi:MULTISPECIES: OmpH family outer membrane protein [Aquabacterium]|jgi:outer membrane protein|uniref:OmpH family outer membrane protein n=1 Tax=Aquabacterium TaxID=92793 RepID=UPI000718DC0D|nr:MULTISPECIES: OmpH family outer membrane protein [Aquabacterium]MBU0918096.1 OmpH family outer membrane protein [Gammaproteobacteria bacterium]
MTSTFKTLVAIAALSCAAAVSAQELKIGFVNLDRVLRDAAMAKAAQAKLEGEFTKREKELLDSESRLKAASDRFDRETASLGESERVRRQRELVDQDRELQRKRREFQEDLNQRKNEELASVLEKANRVVKLIFDQDKYDLIVQEAVFAGPRVDITDKVIKAMNAGSGK